MSFIKTSLGMSFVHQKVSYFWVNAWHLGLPPLNCIKKRAFRNTSSYGSSFHNFPPSQQAQIHLEWAEFLRSFSFLVVKAWLFRAPKELMYGTPSWMRNISTKQKRDFHSNLGGAGWTNGLWTFWWRLHRIHEHWRFILIDLSENNKKGYSETDFSRFIYLIMTAPNGLH